MTLRLITVQDLLECLANWYSHVSGTKTRCTVLVYPSTKRTLQANPLAYMQSLPLVRVVLHLFICNHVALQRVTLYVALWVKDNW